MKKQRRNNARERKLKEKVSVRNFVKTISERENVEADKIESRMEREIHHFLLTKQYSHHGNTLNVFHTYHFCMDRNAKANYLILPTHSTHTLAQASGVRIFPIRDALRHPEKQEKT
jgi:hypothetical protein